MLTKEKRIKVNRKAKPVFEESEYGSEQENLNDAHFYDEVSDRISNNDDYEGGEEDDVFINPKNENLDLVFLFVADVKNKN